MSNSQSISISAPVSFRFMEPVTPVSSKFKNVGEFINKMEVISHAIFEGKLVDDKLNVIPKGKGFFHGVKVALLYVVTVLTFGKYDQFSHVRIHKVMHAILLETYNYRRYQATWQKVGKLFAALDSKFKKEKNKKAVKNFKDNCTLVFSSCVNAINLKDHMISEQKRLEEQKKQQQNEPPKKTLWQKIVG